MNIEEIERHLFVIYGLMLLVTLIFKKKKSIIPLSCSILAFLVVLAQTGISIYLGKVGDALLLILTLFLVSLIVKSDLKNLRHDKD